MNDTPGPTAESEPLSPAPTPPPACPIPDDARIPAEKRERFCEVATLLEQFGQTHLDVELTGFTQELWRRLCRRHWSLDIFCWTHVPG